jgi:hypothetical protein
VLLRGGVLKGSALEADGPDMDSELQDAWRRAGLKLAIGSVLIAAVVGVRIVLVTPADPPDASPGVAPAERGSLGQPREIGEPGQPGETSRGETRDDASGGNESPSEQDGSLGSRLGALGRSVQESLTGSDSTPGEGDRIVACRLQGVPQYMRADDCALRGGLVLGAAR